MTPSKEYNKEYYDTHKDYWKQRRQRIRFEVFEHYGSHCACCGEDELRFLTLDHVAEDGAEHRQQIGTRRNDTDAVFRRLLATDFAEGSSFQVLCWNCNCAKHYLGVCPHQERS